MPSRDGAGTARKAWLLNNGAIFGSGPVSNVGPASWLPHKSCHETRYRRWRFPLSPSSREILFFSKVSPSTWSRDTRARVSYRRIHLGYLRGNQRPLIDDDVVERRYSVGKLLALAGE